MVNSGLDGFKPRRKLENPHFNRLSQTVAVKKKKKKGGGGGGGGSKDKILDNDTGTFQVPIEAYGMDGTFFFFLKCVYEYLGSYTSADRCKGCVPVVCRGRYDVES